jgi:hypothetical protein
MPAARPSEIKPQPEFDTPQSEFRNPNLETGIPDSEIGISDLQIGFLDSFVGTPHSFVRNAECGVNFYNFPLAVEPPAGATGPSSRLKCLPTESAALSFRKPPIPSRACDPDTHPLFVLRRFQTRQRGEEGRRRWFECWLVQAPLAFNS